MMIAKDLLSRAPELRAYASLPEMDPLTEDDALQEAQLLDVRFDVLRLTVGILFELRTALQLRESNTGVLVVRGVRELAWSAVHRSTDLTAWVVDGSYPRAENRQFVLTLGMIWPETELRLVAESAAFFAGDVPGLREAPPNYGDGDVATVRTQLANWDSPFTPVHAVFLDPAPA